MIPSDSFSVIRGCAECGRKAHYERQKVSSIPKEEYQRFLDNDEELALRYGREIRLFQKNKAEVDMERAAAAERFFPHRCRRISANGLTDF